MDYEKINRVLMDIFEDKYEVSISTKTLERRETNEEIHME